MRVEVVGACLTFGSRVVFEDVDAEFASHSVTALSGPSGSGKSSLLAAIAGYQKLTSGQIRLVADNGHAGPPAPANVAWVPQGLNAVGARSALDNVMMAAMAAGLALDDAEAEARERLQLVGLSHRVDDPAQLLSGGELQRLALARALASGKPLILADEPSANLDERNTENVAEILGTLSGTATIIVATHDPLLLARADRVVDLRRPAWT